LSFCSFSCGPLFVFLLFLLWTINMSSIRIKKTPN
jgi:hypothetical protein